MPEPIKLIDSDWILMKGNEPLTVNTIERTWDDSELFDLLSKELTRHLGSQSDPNHDRFIRKLKDLPVGLRAMASTYELDVSLTLDDLGWHFANWRHEGRAREALNGLNELGADEEAAIFGEAIDIALKYWDFIGSETFRHTYEQSMLEQELRPLNVRMYRIRDRKRVDRRSILDYWVPYARTYPENVCDPHASQS